MNKYIKWGILAMILLLIIGMIAYPKLKRKVSTNPGEAVVPVEAPSRGMRTLNVNAEVMKYQPLSDKIVRIGNTMPDEEVDLSFESPGKIVDIFFEEGAHVKKGDLLAKINDRPLQAQLRKLEAQMPLAQDRVFRQKTLLERDAVSQEAYEQVTTELEKLQADIDLVKANIEQTELRAPFDGIIGLRSVSEGAYVSPSVQIAMLTKLSPLKIEFSVPERYSSEVKEGTSITFEIETPDGSKRTYNAHVYAVDSRLDETKNLIVRARYPNTREEIKAGQFASIEITKTEIDNAITVPNEAITPEMGHSIVYIYKNGRAHQTVIEQGLRMSDRTHAINGLAVGDTVITTGVMQLRNEMPISIDNLY